MLLKNYTVHSLQQGIHATLLGVSVVIFSIFITSTQPFEADPKRAGALSLWSAPVVRSLTMRVRREELAEQGSIGLHEIADQYPGSRLLAFKLHSNDPS